MSAIATSSLAAEVALRLAGAADADVDALIVETLATLAEIGDADRAYITKFHPNGTFGTSHEWLAEGVVPHQPAIQNLSVDQFPYSSSFSRAGRVFHVRRLDDLPPEAINERESFGSFGVRSVLEVPIMVDGELLGLVGFNHVTRESDWDDDTIASMQLVGRAIGVALSRRSANERVRNALIAAEQANRAKDELIAAASHELRTPLHAVLGFAELLSLDGIHHEALDQIRSNGRTLLTMIDDLLELGRVAALHTATDDAAPLADMLEQVVHNLEPVAASRHVTIHVDPAPGGEHTVHSAARVHQLLHCVASAALVAAGPAGRVLAALHDHRPALITVTYAGPEHQPVSGLGLALARSFVDSLGGSLTIVDLADAVRIELQCGSEAKP